MAFGAWATKSKGVWLIVRAMNYIQHTIKVIEHIFTDYKTVKVQ